MWMDTGSSVVGQKGKGHQQQNRSLAHADLWLNVDLAELR